MFSQIKLFNILYAFIFFTINSTTSLIMLLPIVQEVYKIWLKLFQLRNFHTFINDTLVKNEIIFKLILSGNVRSNRRNFLQTIEKSIAVESVEALEKNYAQYIQEILLECIARISFVTRTILNRFEFQVEQHSIAKHSNNV